tara:strand:+ start:220 stop:1887 length:1668 start_codon:yes stop_codon:yes gene_type:complete
MLSNKKILILILILGIGFLIFQDQITHKLNAGIRIIKNNEEALITPLTENPLIPNYTKATGPEEIARINSQSNHETLKRLNLFSQSWVRHIDPETNLIPYRLNWGKEYNLYRPEHSGADFYPFLILSSHLTNNQTIPWPQHKYPTNFPAAVDLNKNEIIRKNIVVNYDSTQQMFAASELVKDGLIPLIEFFGEESEYYPQATEIIETIFNNCPHQTEYGCLPALTSEVNGEILISLSRLYLLSKDEIFLDLGQPIFDFYTLNVLPKNDYFLCSNINEESKNCQDTLHLGDHGNEIIPGLIEFYHAFYIKDQTIKKTYHISLKKFLENTKSGLSEDYFWRRTNRKAPKYIDTGDYINSAYYLFSLIDQEPTFINKNLINLANKEIIEFVYEADGIADKIEGVIYLQSVFNNQHIDLWMHKNIHWLNIQQKEPGYILKNYMDGNIARTWILYSLYTSKGAYITPWNENLKIGASIEDNKLYIHIETPIGWKGNLNFINNHITPYYPRINSFPPYFIEKRGTYSLKIENKIYVISGNDLLKNGFEIENGNLIIIEKIK